MHEQMDVRKSKLTFYICIGLTSALGLATQVFIGQLLNSTITSLPCCLAVYFWTLVGVKVMENTLTHPHKYDVLKLD